jgi:ApaG protein
MQRRSLREPRKKIEWALAFLEVALRCPIVMAATLTELEGLRATVDRVQYLPQLEAPPERPHPFVYFITIHNDSDTTVTIKGRKWVVVDAEDQSIVVEGDGVVGKFPRIEPGQSFSYNSYHVIGSDSRAEGAFFGVTDDGEGVFTRIPVFTMETPRA